VNNGPREHEHLGEPLGETLGETQRDISRNDCRFFVFTEKKRDSQTRPFMFALREDQITLLETQSGSHNVYLKVNGRAVEGSFEELLDQLGQRVDFE